MQALQRAGSATRSSKTFDLCGEFVALTNHYMKERIMAYSKCAGSGSANSPLEFEVTRNRRTKDPRAPYTVTVMFKDPPPGMDAEAWRILRAVVKGKELLPDHVLQYLDNCAC